jgi:hypothetical protein
MRYLHCLILLAVATTVPAADVWKWRDANGVVHYSDQPVAGAEPVRVQNSSTYTPPVSSTASGAASSSSSAAIPSYTNVEIWKPSAETTIANSGGLVSVGVRVEPGLAQEHRLALYLDGRLVPGFPEKGTEYDLTDVERGAHTLVLAVLDAKGSQLTLSSSVQFYVQQPSVLLRP